MNRNLLTLSSLLLVSILGPHATAAAPAPALTTDIGVCAVVKQFYGVAEMEKRIELMKAAGINFVRTDFTWRGIERRKGTYDFANHDRMVTTATAHGIGLLGLISHTPAWAAPITDHLNEWLAFVEATVRRYPQVRHWEVFNEPNLESFWGSKPNPAGYAKLLRLTYAKIKSIDPSLFVISAGLAGGNNAGGGYAGNYAEPMVAAGIMDACDAFGFHPYRFPHAPEETDVPRNTYAPKKRTLEETLGKYRALVDANGGAGKPLWITECGYTAMPGPGGDDGVKFATGRNLGVTEEEQAEFLPRSILLAFQYGASSWLWFTMTTAERNPNDKEDWFGLFHRGYAPRLAYHALMALRQAYPAGSKLIREQHLKEPVYRLSWKRPDGNTAWGLWIIERGATKSVPISIRGRLLESYDAIGKPITVSVTNGRATVPLSGRILYLIGPDAVDVQRPVAVR